MDHASQARERGSVADFDTEVYAVYSGFDEAEVIAVIKAMNDKGIISEGRLTKWTERQPQREDDSRDRVRNWREVKRNVTQSNAEISPDKDTDKDTDKDKEEEEGIAEITAAIIAKPPQPLFGQLLDAFFDATDIKESLTDMHAAADEVNKWVSSGVTVEQVKQAVKEMQENNLSIVRPKSITNAINIVRSKGNGKPNSKPAPRNSLADALERRMKNGTT
jgi:hypothetical protein